MDKVISLVKPGLAGAALVVLGCLFLGYIGKGPNTPTWLAK